MLVSFVYVVACRLLALVVLLARSDRSKELELPKAASGERNLRSRDHDRGAG